MNYSDKEDMKKRVSQHKAIYTINANNNNILNIFVFYNPENSTNKTKCEERIEAFYNEYFSTTEQEEIENLKNIDFTINDNTFSLPKSSLKWLLNYNNKSRVFLYYTDIEMFKNIQKLRNMGYREIVDVENNNKYLHFYNKNEKGRYKAFTLHSLVLGYSSKKEMKTEHNPIEIKERQSNYVEELNRLDKSIIDHSSPIDRAISKNMGIDTTNVSNCILNGILHEYRENDLIEKKLLSSNNCLDNFSYLNHDFNSQEKPYTIDYNENIKIAVDREKQEINVTLFFNEGLGYLNDWQIIDIEGEKIKIDTLAIIYPFVSTEEEHIKKQKEAIIEECIKFLNINIKELKERRKKEKEEGSYIFISSKGYEKNIDTSKLSEYIKGKHILYRPKKDYQKINGEWELIGIDHIKEPYHNRKILTKDQPTVVEKFL